MLNSTEALFTYLTDNQLKEISCNIHAFAVTVPKIPNTESRLSVLDIEGFTGDVSAWPTMEAAEQEAARIGGALNLVDAKTYLFFPRG